MRSQKKRGAQAEERSSGSNNKAAAPTIAPANSSNAKKKSKAMGLEQQAKMLEDENLSLRLQLKVGKESVKQDEEKKVDIISQISELISTTPLEQTQLRRLLVAYTVRYSDWSSDHVDTVDNHMVQIQRLLAPTKVTKLCLWTLNQDDEFFKPVLSPNESLFQIMGEVIEGTLDQTEEFKNYRQNAKQLTRGLRFTDRECDDLRQRLKRKHRALAEEMHELQDILSPDQLAKLIIWANKNEKLQETLKKEWVGWTDPQEVEERRRQMRKEEKKFTAKAATTSADDEDEEDDE